MKIDKQNWKKVKFGDVAVQQKDVVDIEATHLNRYIAGEHMDSEDIHLRKWGYIGNGYLGPAFIRKFEKGDVLYGSRRTYLKKIALADFEGITANTTFVIKPNTKLIDHRLLPFLMLSEGFTKHSIENSKGSVNPYINWKDIANYEFFLPQKEEQARLAELLWAADEVVERENEVVDKLKNIRMTLFENSFNKNNRQTKLGNCLCLKKEKSKAPHDLKNYIGLEHIVTGSYYTDFHGNSNSALADNYVFKPGDILYSKLRPYLDKAVIATFEGVCTTELLVYNATEKTSSEYILNLLHSKDFLNYIVDKSYGTKMPRVSHEIVSDYTFFLPEMKEQEKILTELTKIGKSLSDAEICMTQSQQLKSSLINQIF